MNNNRNNNPPRRPPDEDNFLSHVSTGAAIGGGVVARNYRQSEKPYINGPYGRRDVQIVSNGKDLSEAMGKLRSNCDEYNLLGFDCEWNPWNPYQKLSLLQLSTKDYCALIRISNFLSVPDDLKQLLRDDRLIKVGVEPLKSARKLNEDYGVRVFSTLDLRFMAEECNLNPNSLKKMSEDYLNIRLEKYKFDWNWNTFQLTDEQINYVANNAQTGIRLFHKFGGIISEGHRIPAFKTIRRKVEVYFDIHFPLVLSQ